MEFYEKFKAENGSCICRDLLGYDFGKSEDLEKLRETKIYLNICPNLVKSVVKITENILFRKENAVLTSEDFNK